LACILQASSALSKAPRSRHPTSASAGSELQRNTAHKQVYKAVGQSQARTPSSRSNQRSGANMETMQLLLIAAAVAAACGALFVAWAATSDSREARVYRRKWKEFRLKNSKRNTSKYRGVGAGGGIHAASGERGLRYLRSRRWRAREIFTPPPTPSTCDGRGDGVLVAGTASVRHRRGAPRRRERARQARRLA